ncbi:AAA family ATPase [Patescibacteria group bacterium]|nr:AAA family ATPase [Patescibacteria group bacterium]
MTQNQALQILNKGHNIYLTGPAGSGKTFLLNKFIEDLNKKGVGVGITASTGIAATHLDGVTIHSWAGIGINEELTDKQITSLKTKAYLKKRFTKTNVLIIDEVSMLHSHTLDLVDRVCKIFKGNSLPFGGIQVVLCGDFFQLPPVNKYGQELNFINESNAWRNMDLKICYLNEQFRQEDNKLTKILNEIRENNITDATRNAIMTRYKKDINSDISPTKLYTHNIDVDYINNTELNKLTEKSKIYSMHCKGPDNLVDIIKKNCLAPETLILKKGTIVMFVKNNFSKGYVNGTLGIVINFENGHPVVETIAGKKIFVETEDWKINENELTKAEIKQIPLRLAWAITIHKSQGMSLDAAEIDLSKSFICGMGYVALSRVRTLSGIKLMGINNKALEVDSNVLEFDKKLKLLSRMGL